MSSEVLQLIAVVVYKPAVVDADGGWTFHHLARKRFRGPAPRAIRRRGISHLDVAFRTGVVLQYHDVVVFIALDKCSVDAREAWVNHQLRRRKGLEVLRSSIVEPVVVLMILLTVWEYAWDARCPDDDSLLLDIVPKQFWRPDIHCRRVRHHLDKSLFRPVYQVLR